MIKLHLEMTDAGVCFVNAWTDTKPGTRKEWSVYRTFKMDDPGYLVNDEVLQDWTSVLEQIQATLEELTT